MKAVAASILMVLLLGGCGGDTQTGDVPATSPAPEQKPRAPASDAGNPLATQVQALQDAKKVQEILDKDAERKKKAIDNAN